MSEPTANDVAMWVAHELSEVLDDSSGLYPAGVQIIAAALTAEREKARAPFLALADEYDANINWREWGIGNRIRRVAEERQQ